MQKVAYHNPTNRIQHVGSVMVMPHTSREVDPRDIPGHQPAEQAPPAPDDPILALLDNSIPEIKKGLPGLSDEDLDKLEAAEIDGKTRTGLLEAIAEERLNRSQDEGGDSGEGEGE